MILNLNSLQRISCVLLLASACKGDGGGDESTPTDPGTGTAPMTEGMEGTEGTPTEGTATEATPTEGGTDDATTDGTTGAMSDPELKMLCDESFAAGQQIVEAQCQCSVELGSFPDVQTCLDESENEGVATDECVCSVYSEFPQTKAGIECARPAQMTYLACINGVSCASDAEAFEACAEAYYTTVGACDMPEDGALAKVALQCEMLEPFNCGSGEVIPVTWKCDFDVNCTDLSDEAGCPDSFMCADGTAYVPMEYKCDGGEDCMDGSDEAGCPKFMCMDGMQIPEQWKCDGFADCDDMSDEGSMAGCPVFMCMSGEEIPEGWKCNEIEDCMDGSDEGSMAGCPVFMCMNGEEIPASGECNGFPQCEDGSDEEGCPTFMCMNGEEIPLSWKCDGLPDCRDMSDEADCP